MNNKKIIALVLTTILIGGNTIQVSATPQVSNVAEAGQKYEEIEAKIAGIQDKIYELNTKIEPLQETIEKNKKEIEDINNTIDSTTKYIEQCKKEITELDKALGERVTTMYKSGNVEFGYLNFILEAESTKDLFSRFQALSNIIGKDKKSIEEVESKKEEMNEKIESLEVKKKEIDELTEKTETSLKELDVKKEEQEVLIKEAKEERSKFDAEYLSVLERNSVKELFNMVNDPNIDLQGIKDAIYRLRQARDNTIKSPIVEKEINEVIEKAKLIRDAMEEEQEKAIEKAKEENKQTQSTNSSSGNNSGSGNSNGSGSNSGSNNGGGSSSTTQPNQSKVSILLNEAYKHLGKPYKRAATGPDSFDCSGFTQYVYKHALNIDITRTTFTQIGQGRAVSQAELQPGDLVFPHDGHVGIYVGGGQMIHAPQTGDVVKIAPVYRFYAARRIL